MSFYATIEGKLEYKDKESFDRAVKLLEDARFLNKGGYFVDECNDVVDGSNKIVDESNLRISIPFGCYRNLSYLLRDDALFTGTKQYHVVWASTDGVFVGGVLTDGRSEQYDLDVWAREHVLEDGDVVPDPETDLDAWVAYTEEVLYEFMNAHS